MKILVTGAAGFVGSHFVRYLLGNNQTTVNINQVVSIDSLTYAGSMSRLDDALPNVRHSFFRGDVRDTDFIIRHGKGANIFVHFAAETHVDRSIRDARTFFDTNVMGTQSLLEAARTLKVETVIHISTDEVYGPATEILCDETSALMPSSPYAASKAAADLCALSYSRTYDLDIRIIRSSNIYGPFQHPEKVIPTFVLCALSGAPLPIYGDGQQTRNWLHVQDYCRALGLALRRGRRGEIYNVVGKTQITNNALAHLILETLGLPGHPISHLIDRVAHDRGYSIDGRKMREQLGFSESVDFSKGIRETVTWLADHADMWRREFQSDIA